MNLRKVGASFVASMKLSLTVVAVTFVTICSISQTVPQSVPQFSAGTSNGPQIANGLLTTNFVMPSIRSESELLKEEIQVIRSYDDKLIANVHWVFGLVFSIALLLVGYQWISANKLYERDKDALRKGIIGEIEEREAALEKDLRKTIQNILSETSARFLDLNREITEKFGQATALFGEKHGAFTQEVLTLVNDTNQNVTRLEGKVTESLSSQRLDLEKQIRMLVEQSAKGLTFSLETSFKQALDSLDSKHKAAISETNSTLSFLQHKVDTLSYNVNLHEASLAEEKEHYGGAYTAYYKALDLVVKFGWGFAESTLLDNLIRVLEKGAPLLKHEVESAEALVPKLSAESKEKGIQFIALVKKATILGIP